MPMDESPSGPLVVHFVAVNATVVGIDAIAIAIAGRLLHYC